MRAVFLCVDLSEATRYLAHATVKLPVRPGTVARFTTPLWIPESHIANGPVSGVANLHFYHDKNEVTHQLEWSRNPLAAHEYLVHTPPEVDSIYAEFDAIISRDVSRWIILFGWEHVLLYPIGAVGEESISRFNLDKLPIQATVVAPKEWGVATALENLGEPSIFVKGTKKVYSYGATTVRALADSPILAARHFSKCTIHDGSSKETQEVLCLAADKEEYARIDPSLVNSLSKVISQIQLLFGGGPPPYAHSPAQRPKTAPQRDEKKYPNKTFYFLVALSSHLPNKGGIEHLASTAIIAPLNGFSTPFQLKLNLSLLAHEYIHCWNGKLLTPKGHHPNDFNTSLDGRLLWVYEGLTTYYEYVIPVRAGVISKEEWIANLAGQVAERMGDMGRRWRSLEDLGAGTSVMRGGLAGWERWRGEREGVYNGGALVWLGVDVLLRRLTADSRTGPKSLDDFMERFFGLPREHRDPASDLRIPTGGLHHRRTNSTLTEYTLDDIAIELNNICGYNWKHHFQTTVVGVNPEVDLFAIKQAGYLFRWTAEPRVTDEHEGEEDIDKDVIERELEELKEAIWNSIGLKVDIMGEVGDVRRWGPADKARLSPKQTVIGVGQRGKAKEGEFIIDLLGDEIKRAAESETEPIRLLMEHEGDEWIAEIDYHDGLRYPVIERDEDSGLSDLFEDILRPLTPSYQLVRR